MVSQIGGLRSRLALDVTRRPRDLRSTLASARRELVAASRHDFELDAKRKKNVGRQNAPQTL